MKLFAIETTERRLKICILGFKIKISKSLYHKYENFHLQKALKKCEFVHVMFNDKFNKPYVDFLNNYFDAQKHVVLCYQFFPDKMPTLFPVGRNVFKIVDLNNIPLNLPNVKKIIFHSLTDLWVDYLYSHQDILKQKAYWCIWGADLYNAPRDEKNDFVRKNFKGYCGLIDRDYALAKYAMHDNFYNVHYIFPTLLSLPTISNSNDTVVRIQVNNSCDQSTLEMLEVLSRFKDKNIKIRTILSYGQMDFKQAIIEKGKDIFGDKFEYLDQLLLPEEYEKYVSQNSVLVLNQNRQQGVGNILLNIQLGNKVFIRSDISTYKYLSEVEHVHIFDTKTIPQLSFDEFIWNDYQVQNSENIKEHTDLDCLAKLWESFFNA